MKTIATIKTETGNVITAAKAAVIDAIRNSDVIIASDFVDNWLSKFETGEPVSDRLWEKHTFGAEYQYQVIDGGFIASGYSCGGNYFRIEISCDKISVEHSGRRGGYPGNMLNILPEELKDSSLWTLEVYETSEPSWAPVNAFLTGSFGRTGFTSQYEKDQAELSGLCDKIKDLANILGRNIDYQNMPISVAEAECMYKNMLNTCHGVEYRRLKASGY